MQNPINRLVILAALSGALNIAAAARPVAPPPAPAAEAIEVQGTLQRYLLTPHGEIDGLLLEDGTQVQLPPRLSAQIQSTLRPGAKLRVQGEAQPSGVVRAELAEDLRNGRKVIDVPPETDRPLPARTALLRMQTEGRIDTVLRAPRGEAAGAVLDNGAIVRFPPRLGGQLAALLRTGGRLAASGYGTRTPYGDVLEATDIGTTLANMQALYERPLARDPLAGPEDDPAALRAR